MTGDQLIRVGNENVQIGLVPAQGKRKTTEAAAAVQRSVQ